MPQPPDTASTTQAPAAQAAKPAAEAAAKAAKPAAQVAAKPAAEAAAQAAKPAAEAAGLRYPSWRRVVLKLSGGLFAGNEPLGISPDVVQHLADEILTAAKEGVQVAAVVGGGNMFRGAALAERGIDRARADYMGMLSTVINCLALQDVLEKRGVDTRVQTAITMGQVAEPYIPRKAIRHLEKGRVVIFGAGLGAPFFSTDTCAAQRALEMGADAVLKGTKVDGVYDSDPKANLLAKRFRNIDYAEYLSRGLKVMDATAVSLCMDNGLPIVVFALMGEGNVVRAIRGEEVGTLVSSQPSQPSPPSRPSQPSPPSRPSTPTGPSELSEES